MQAVEFQVYLDKSIQIFLAYLDENQSDNVRNEALDALSGLITASKESIMPYRDTLLKTFYETVIKSTAVTE